MKGIMKELVSQSTWTTLYLTLLALASLLAGQGKAQTQMTSSSVFQCQSSSENPDEFYTPNIPDDYFDPNFVAMRSGGPAPLLQMSENTFIHVFTIPTEDLDNCSGTVMAFEFCHHSTDNDVTFANRSRRVFEFLQLREQGELQYVVEKVLDIRSIANSSICASTPEPSSSQQICCNRVTLRTSQVDFNISADSAGYIYGITTRYRSPLIFTNATNEFRATYYRWSETVAYPTPVGLNFTLSDTDQMVNAPILHIRLITGTPEIVTEPSTNPTDPPNDSSLNLPVIAGAVTGAVVLVLLVLVLLVALPLLCRKKERKAILMKKISIKTKQKNQVSVVVTDNDTVYQREMLPVIEEGATTSSMEFNVNYNVSQTRTPSPVSNRASPKPSGLSPNFSTPDRDGGELAERNYDVPYSNRASPRASPLPPVYSRALPVPHSNRASPVPHSNRASPMPHSNRASPVPHSNRASPMPHSNRTSPVPHSNGPLPSEPTNVDTSIELNRNRAYAQPVTSSYHEYDNPW